MVPLSMPQLLMPIEKHPAVRPPAAAGHISDQDLEAFVIEQLTNEQSCRILAHVLECGHCSLRLVREAFLIETLRATLEFDRCN
jgi:hypothetical protein